MKLAFLFGSMSRGGAERVIASLANTFCAAGDEISIITMDNNPSGYALDERVRHIRLNLAGKSKNKMEALIRNFRILRSLRKEIKRAGYDAVITFELRQAVLLQYAFPAGRKFKIITSERANPNTRKLARFEKKQYDKMLPKVDGFIFQTKRVSLCYCERLREIGTVIHNGVFPEILPAEIPAFADRRHKDICAVGRLAEQKGYDILLRAFHLFGETHPEHRLHIYGEGALRKALEEQIAALGLGDRVTLHGSVANVMFQVFDMGMFVMASRFEGMPNALMEAMACGVPCISTNCDFGPEELVTDHENGILVAVDDEKAIAAAMAEIADSPELAQKLSENARKIRETHSGDRIADRYHTYISDVIHERNKETGVQ